ncbi:hypothetical protein [Pragia fontium]|uniref:hypothetical protein n=1 Tax=Pragia fontium TaxID=82985 RepID=UPI00349EA534
MSWQAGSRYFINRKLYHFNGVNYELSISLLWLFIFDKSYPLSNPNTSACTHYYGCAKNAFTRCQTAEKEMRYSFGKDSAQYKDRWCQKRSTGRIITL